MNLSKMKQLSFKLPVFVATMIIVVATSLSVQTFLSGRTSFSEQAMLKLELVAAKRSQALAGWYDQLQAIVNNKATNPETLDAFQEFQTNFARLDDQGRDTISQAYTTLSPYGPGERDTLDRAEGASFYHVAHERRHPALRSFNNDFGFYDTFLLDMDGNIIYSVFKESDFGQNVLTSALSNSGISRAFRDASIGSGGQVFFSGFDTYAPSNGSVAAFASTPIKNPEGETIGVLIVQVDTENFANVINDPLGLDETGQAVLIDEDGRSVVESRFENGPATFDVLPITDQVASARGGTRVVAEDVVGLASPSVSTVVIPTSLGSEEYVLLVEKSTSEILKDLVSLRNKLIIMSVAYAVIVSLLIWLYTRSVTSALKRLQHKMVQISDGDYAVEIDATKREDEIGSIGRTLVDFKSKLSTANDQAQERERGQVEQQEVLETLRNGLVNLAEGDLSQPIETEFGEQYESLRKDFNETLRTLSEAISNVILVSKSIQSGASEISQASDDLSNRTENQAATLEETAAALDELTASVRSAAEGAKSVETIVVEAQSEAEESGAIVRDAIDAMTEIEKSSEHISQIIGVIDDIAFQTNLLALNAGVEAARAGDAGKGFAVVASEVRALAQRSSEAAKEIKTLISGSAKQVERGVELVGGAGTALGKIVERVTHISDLIRNMATGSSEQAIGLGEINIGVNQLDQVTQQNAAMVEEATASSHVLKNDAEQLQELVTRFKADKNYQSTIGYTSTSSPADVTPVQFKRSEDNRSEPEPIPMAVGDDVNSRPSNSAIDDEWIDF